MGLAPGIPKTCFQHPQDIVVLLSKSQINKWANFFPSQYHNVIFYFDRFLFEKEETGQKNKVILYTGDFRLEHIRLPTLKDLHTSAGEPIKIDIMYLDTTFCSKEYENFPLRDEAIQAIWDLVNSWIKKNGKN